MTHKEFESILPSVRKQAYQTAFAFFADHSDADDVAQEAIIRMWNYCEQLDARQNIEGLTIQVAKRICIDIYRQRSLIHKVPIDSSITSYAPNTDSPDSSITQQQTKQIIIQSFHELQPREQQILRLHNKDLTSDNISQQTNIPLRSLRSMIAMAKNKLKTNIKNKLK